MRRRSSSRSTLTPLRTASSTPRRSLVSTSTLCADVTSSFQFGLPSALCSYSLFTDDVILWISIFRHQRSVIDVPAAQTRELRRWPPPSSRQQQTETRPVLNTLHSHSVDGLWKRFGKESIYLIFLLRTLSVDMWLGKYIARKENTLFLMCWLV